MTNKKYIPLFYPYVTEEMRRAAYDALGEKMIGQGKKVNQFEKRLCAVFNVNNLLTVNSATSALELAYHLLNLKNGDEVISPVFTCIATNIPLVRRGVKIIFADVQDNMTLDWKDVKRKISNKTKAIVNVHLFGQLSEAEKLPIPVIGDAAQYLGKTKNERFTAYSFQTIKNITTVDGGALICKKNNDYKRAKLLRWYGIDRETEKENIYEDIVEPGFKYHMNNVTAAIGLAALDNFKAIKSKLKILQRHYFEGLKDINGITPVGGSPFLIHADKRAKLIKKLSEKGIETSLMQRRNDIYSVFGGKRLNLTNMNRLEKTYLLLPCHPKIKHNQIDYVCEEIRKVKL